MMAAMRTAPFKVSLKLEKYYDEPALVGEEDQVNQARFLLLIGGLKQDQLIFRVINHDSSVSETGLY